MSPAGKSSFRVSQLDSVTVFGHFLHMHENGKRLVTTQYRDDGDGNEVVVFTAEVEYYSFQQAGAFWAMANDSVTIQVRERSVRFGSVRLGSVGFDWLGVA